MFCSDCGNKISDNAKFCRHCGAKQDEFEVVNEKPVVNVAETKAEKPKTEIKREKPVPEIKQEKSATENDKKKESNKTTNIIVVIVVFLCASLIGKFVIAPSFAPESTATPRPTGNGLPNPAYNDVFEDANIVYSPSFFNMETANFVIKSEDGVITCHDFGYKNDVIIAWTQTIYTPVSNLNDSQKNELENELRNSCEDFDSFDFCTVRYNLGTLYYTITVEFRDLDKSKNYSELYDNDLIDKNKSMTMSQTEKDLLKDGYIKK